MLKSKQLASKIAAEIKRDLKLTPKEEKLVKTFSEVAVLNIRTFISKNRKYGSANIEKHGQYGVHVRMSDKMSRIESLLKSGEKSSESIEDSALDLSNYCLIFYLLGKKKWKS